eukprot:scaffold161402_cov30-Tisochrysis_lutea.AAC.8
MRHAILLGAERRVENDERCVAAASTSWPVELVDGERVSKGEYPLRVDFGDSGACADACARVGERHVDQWCDVGRAPIGGQHVRAAARVEPRGRVVWHCKLCRLRHSNLPPHLNARREDVGREEHAEQSEP